MSELALAWGNAIVLGVAVFAGAAILDLFLMCRRMLRQNEGARHECDDSST